MNTETESPSADYENGGIDGIDGIDAIIARVESYRADPKMVTPETLDEVLNELMDLKGYLSGDGEDQMEYENPSEMAGMMNKMRSEQ